MHMWFIRLTTGTRSFSQLQQRDHCLHSAMIHTFVATLLQITTLATNKKNRAGEWSLNVIWKQFGFWTATPTAVEVTVWAGSNVFYIESQKCFCVCLQLWKKGERIQGHVCLNSLQCKYFDLVVTLDSGLCACCRNLNISMHVFYQKKHQTYVYNTGLSHSAGATGVLHAMVFHPNHANINYRIHV